MTVLTLFGPAEPTDKSVVGTANTVNVLPEINNAGNLIWVGRPGVMLAKEWITFPPDHEPPPALPDLIISALTAPANGTVGGLITVSDTTKNQGAGSAGASTTSFYLSTLTTLDYTAVLLGSRTVAALAQDAVDSADTELTIPDGTLAGTYYVLAYADSDTAVDETDENNNVRASESIDITVVSDLCSLTVYTWTLAPGNPAAVDPWTYNVDGTLYSPNIGPLMDAGQPPREAHTFITPGAGVRGVFRITYRNSSNSYMTIQVSGQPFMQNLLPSVVSKSAHINTAGIALNGKINVAVWNYARVADQGSNPQPNSESWIECVQIAIGDWPEGETSGRIYYDS